ncbi:PAS domain S-box protein [Sulfuricystis multivorans]|uniref:PAS domain S-box protein n=1 Tax=Sulfuricystis multivorans TaxID=2211108 RepID=UPI000F821DBB|nr:PAS domain S-box protein [Sulfuricystis multivorans]
MRHSKEAQERAVALMRAGEKPLLDIAREFNVSTTTLRTWFRASEARVRAQLSAKRVATALSQEKYTRASQRQRLLMHALEQSPATIIVTDSEGKIVYANPKFVSTTGYRIEEVIGLTPRILKSGETSPEEYRRLWNTIKAGREWRGVFHNRRKDGSLYWERASISPVHDAKGRITHFMAVKEDITSFMEADAARRRIAAEFTAVFAALPAAIVVIDAQQRILLANPAAEVLLGAPLARGMRFAELNLRWVDADSAALAVADHPVLQLLAAAGNDTARQAVVGVIPPKGGVRWLRCQCRTVAMPENDEAVVLMVMNEADEPQGSAAE